MVSFFAMHLNCFVRHLMMLCLGCHVVGVSPGTVIDTSTLSIDIFFPNDKRLEIVGDSFVLKQYGSSGDVVYESEVVVTGQATRRLDLIQGHVDGSGADVSSMLSRCSVDEGVCYHTYDEIVALSKPSRLERERGIARGRHLATDEEVVTYSQLNADAAILTKDKRSGLVRP
jgi:hypothetical protein